MELSPGPQPGSEGKGQSDTHTAGADTSLSLLQRGRNSGFGEEKGRSTPAGFQVAGCGQGVSARVTWGLQAPGARQGPARS